MAFLLFAGVPATAAAQDEESAEDGPEEGIDIDISGSAGRELTPMAIPETRRSGDGGESVAEEVDETLQRNMKLAGLFKLLPRDSFFFDPSEEGMGVSSVNFDNWFETGAQALIKSEVRQDGDRVRLDLRLYDVEDGEQVDLDWSSEEVSRDDYVDEVHDFSNAVVDHFTGKPGVFGTEIAYVKQAGAGKEVYVMEMDGTDQQRITRGGHLNMIPFFSDGIIYYTSYRDGNPDLWVYEDGSRRKLSSKKGQNTGAARCDDKLALTLSRGGDNTDIYLIDPDSGKIEKRLTDHFAIDTSPTFNPDCSRIAFVSDRSGGPQIYVMDVDGGDQKRLTFQGSYNTEPSWSPDGDLIAFSARDERAAFDIFTVDLDGEIERLTQDQGNNSDPSFSPDGRYIAFVSDRGGEGKRIFVMTSDGEVQNPITEGSGFRAPFWEK
ncbi:MAG: DPP IV N-terminal domain-containing protein [Persicimonas sp.]